MEEKYVGCVHFREEGEGIGLIAWTPSPRLFLQTPHWGNRLPAWLIHVLCQNSPRIIQDFPDTPTIHNS